jgi:RNA polymerase sigma-70 factor (ECF subfamily)
VNNADRDAVRAIRGGDRDALAQLVQRYQGRLFGLMTMMVRNPVAAEELAQDAFVRAYTHLDHYDERRPFYPWLATIAVRLAQNWLHHRARLEQREGAALDDAWEPAAAASALNGMIADERSRRVWQVVAGLPSAERTAVLLYYREELPLGDIARTLGLTSGTIKTLLFRARRHLRERLGSALAGEFLP